MEDLQSACSACVFGPDSEEKVSRRQIFKDIQFMESKKGYAIELHRVRDGKRIWYRYEDPNFSIDQRPISELEIVQLQQTIKLLDRFKGMPGFDWLDELLMQLRTQFGVRASNRSVISFEHNSRLAGLRFLSPLFNAIIHHRVLHIVYRNFKDRQLVWFIHPYYLKEYNNRWFLFGYNEENQSITNLALDRIQEITETDHTFRVNLGINFDTYFQDVVGVTLPEESLQTVILQFSPERFPYITSKPIHPSQQILSAEEHKVSLRVIPNPELLSQILSFGSDVTVLAPDSLREQIQEEISRTLGKYS
jgi:predicted DNA-binding transcriptional regulator YafY